MVSRAELVVVHLLDASQGVFVRRNFLVMESFFDNTCIECAVMINVSEARGKFLSSSLISIRWCVWCSDGELADWEGVT